MAADVGHPTNRPTHSAIIIPVAAAEGVVGAHRRRLDTAASWGVPAHVTVLFPFVPPGELDFEVITRLKTLFSKARPFHCTFDRCCWFGEDVLWLGPDRDQAFRDLTSGVFEAFPAYPPFGGEFAEVIPHLTVATSSGGTAEQLHEAEAVVSRQLPIEAHIELAVLMTGTDKPNSWKVEAKLPLGGT